jgi:MtN3 and saliva related transmembrane protein
MIGTAAAILTMFSFVPQIIKVIKYKSARDVSEITLFQMSAGVALWLIYGFGRHDVIIILANGITLLSLVILLFLYFNYSR